MDRFVQGIDLHDNDMPQNREWLDLIVAVKWRSNEEETLKDIISDTVGFVVMFEIDYKFDGKITSSKNLNFRHTKIHFIILYHRAF